MPLPNSRAVAAAVALLCAQVKGQADLFSLIPDPTDFYATEGMAYFQKTALRYSQTVRIYSPAQQSFWGPVYDELIEDYYMAGNHPNPPTENEEFEIIDAGTLNNIPRNTRPRNPDLLDTGTQHFAVRFNESFVLRSETVNRYVATRGVNFQSDMYLTDDVDKAERFTVLPVRTFIQPHYMPMADNNNIEDQTTYVLNGTNCHLINEQLNFMNKIHGVDRLVSQGPGTRKKGMWKDGDVFQIHMKKPFEG